jgi:hypothetical protein
VTKDSHLSIWFFVGILLTFYGLIITGAGIYGLFVPPPTVLSNLHADLWWGAILLAIGVFYCWHFNPSIASAQKAVHKELGDEV